MEGCVNVISWSRSTPEIECFGAKDSLIVDPVEHAACERPSMCVWMCWCVRILVCSRSAQGWTYFQEARAGTHTDRHAHVGTRAHTHHATRLSYIHMSARAYTHAPSVTRTVRMQTHTRATLSDFSHALRGLAVSFRARTVDKDRQFPQSQIHQSCRAPTQD